MHTYVKPERERERVFTYIRETGNHYKNTETRSTKKKDKKRKKKKIAQAIIVSNLNT